MKRGNGKTYLTAIFVYAVFECCLCGCRERPAQVSFQDSIGLAISRGFTYLSERQLKSGEINSTACVDILGEQCLDDSSPFVTSLVLYSIYGLENEKGKAIAKKAVRFLLEEQKEGTVWSYWSSHNSKSINPDLDDTSIISYALRLYGIDFGENKSTIAQNVDEEGRFLTWFNMPRKYNDVDCVVNANVLLYLGKNIPQVCNYLNNAIDESFSCSHYYINQLAQFYSYSKAYVHGVDCLGKNRDRIIEATLRHKKPDHSFGSTFYTALAVNVLLNYSYQGSETRLAVEYLLENQADDGSWMSDVFYKGPKDCIECLYWRSTELSTAFAIEALKKYRSFPHNL